VTFTLAFLALQRVQGTFTSLQSLEMARVDDAARGPSYVFRRDPTGPTARQPSPPQPAGQRR
jgi:hypothetical protein